MDWISAKIDVKKIDKTALFVGEKGTYLDVTLIPNKNGQDQYGNDYIVTQDISKERREAGERGPIIGNAKVREYKKKTNDAQPPATKTDTADDLGF